MLCGALASCATEIPAETTVAESDSEASAQTSSAVSGSDNETETVTYDNILTSEAETATAGESLPETQESSSTEDSSTVEESEEGEEIPVESLTGEHAELIENADSLKNGVTAYYESGDRESVVFENLEMLLGYSLASGSSQQVTVLANKSGNAYVTDSMDVFVRMTDNKTYYAKDSYTSSVFNIYRFGYYYYEMKVEGQSFVGNISSDEAHIIDLSKLSSGNELDRIIYKNGVLNLKNKKNSIDPYVVLGEGLALSANEYTMLEITIKSTGASSIADVYFVAGERTSYNATQMLRFNLVDDGEYHTYRVPLYTGAEYIGDLKALRLDISGSEAVYEIKDARFLALDVESVPADLNLCRTFNVYSDKLHQTIQIAATAETENILEIGMVTRIPADTVAKVVLEDKDGIRYTLDGADWDSVEYIGFDILGAGIFGYILPYDGKGGKLEVEIVDGVYVIEQTMSPEGGTIKPSRTTFNSDKKYYNWVSGGNTNDFYMGQRIYTDESHDFTEFLYEAYCERNPLYEKRFHVYPDSSDGSSFAGYDSLRGIYRFNMAGATNFNQPYYSDPNKHYRTNFAIVGDDVDRKIYAMTYTSSGFLECAALLDENDVMLPVSLEVGKNFSEPYGERGLFNLADSAYGEVIFPLVISKGEKYEYTVLNIYQNWGSYPLKQISWIQYFSPYYHLSTGVTETNCIAPWTFTNHIWYNTLPDFRGMSAPMWTSQPQHTSCCDHDWLRYVDENGSVIRAENVQNIIDSYGPTYADVKMNYISYDGKIKVSYTHTEMPQTDENRTYYEIKYEILGDVTINDVVNNLQLYKVSPNDSTGTYQKVGYLNEQNESVVVEANETTSPVKYTLGNACPYFSFFDMDNCSSGDGYGNFGFLVYNADFNIASEESSPAFAIVNHTDTVYLTLDLEELTLKAGDSITINCILLPWGSQELEDGVIDEEKNNYEYTMELEGGDLYMDKNVRDVRENTLLKPITAIAGENAEVIESVFVPKLRTTNGTSAEFTLSGGYNNVAVRIYGFNKSTVPVIYEKIDGEWVIYNVSSSESEKDPHRYDGYCVHYDGNGTFSYSFVTDMDGESERSFKIVTDGNYTEWNKEVYDEDASSRPDHLNIYVDAVEISNETRAMIASQFIGKYEIAEDESYIRLYGYGESSEYAESYATIYKPSVAKQESGRYLAIKYRLSADNKEKVSVFDFFISTSSTNPGNDCAIYVTNVNNDGNWHTVIVDLEMIEREAFKAHFAAGDDGKYYPKFIRLDFFDRRMSAESYIDIAFVGMDDSLADIAALSQDCSSVLLREGNATTEVDIATGEKIDLSVPSVLVDPSSGYTLSDIEYGAQIDKINGVSIGIQGSSKAGVASILHNNGTIADRTVTDCATVEGYNLVLGGWCVIEGGVDRYVWSADGGKTWHNALSFGRSPGNAESAMIDAAYERSNKSYTFTLEADSANGTFQGAEGKNPTGLSLNLEDYSGQTVNIIFAAVPKKDMSTILPIFYITRVKVSE